MKARMVRLDNSTVGRPRAAWSEAFRAMAGHGDDELLDDTRPTRWDEHEWQSPPLEAAHEQAPRRPR